MTEPVASDASSASGILPADSWSNTLSRLSSPKRGTGDGGSGLLESEEGESRVPDDIFTVCREAPDSVRAEDNEGGWSGPSLEALPSFGFCASSALMSFP